MALKPHCCGGAITLVALAWLPASFASAARADTPMSYLRTYGPAADPVTWLNYGLMAISVIVTVLIGGLVLWATLRKRSPMVADENGRLPVGPARGGMRWIYIGVGISTLVLLASTAWTLLTLSAVAAPQGRSALAVDVIGHQWWWEVRYHDSDPTNGFVTANEIHIPVGRPVRLTLTSTDVIHSFWVPQLAGKTDMIPGQTNFAWMQADRPGDYRGQCGEYCGAQHAHMALHVIADEPAAFDAWRRRQRRDAAVAQAPLAMQGNDVFVAHCSACHAVRGSSAGGALGQDLNQPINRSAVASSTTPNNSDILIGSIGNTKTRKAGTSLQARDFSPQDFRAVVAVGGIPGPDLTHLMSRAMIASGTLANNTGNLSGWVADPQALKPGSRMPTLDLSANDLRAVVIYLETLK